MTWQVQDAKNKMSQLMDDSLSKGPQVISRRGTPTTVMISYADYKRLVQPPRTLQELARDFRGLEIPEIVRDHSVSGRATPLDFNELDI